MKKLLSILALALAFVACQNEPGVGDKSDAATVILNVAAPELDATRADADANAGKNSAFGAIDFFNDADWANYDVRYILEVYAAEDDGTGEPIYRERLVNYLDKYAPTQFELRLVPNREYKFVVFADFVKQGTTTDLFYDTTDLRNVTAKTDAEGWNAMNEVRDAYFVSENIEVSTSLSKTLTLKRPFGKVRVIATDLDYIAGYSAPGYVEITYKNEPLYKSFNAVNGQLSTTELSGNELVYGYEVKKDAPYTEGYDAEAKNQTLFADYLFAREGQQMPINFTMAVYESKGGRLIKTTDFNTQIPVQRNYLTTITGDILTTQANITIMIDDNFDGEMVNPSIEAPIAAPFVTATVDGNAVTLAWNAVEGAVKYYTRRVAEGNVAFEETAECTKVYENLEYETEYTFEVYAVSEKGIVSETTAVKATTGKAPVIPALATPEVNASVDVNVVTLTWAAIEGASHYTVQVDDDVEETVNATTYVFEGDYEVEYTFTVKAIAADTTKNTNSEAAVVTATTEAKPAVGPATLTVAEFLALTDVVPSDATADEIAAAPLYTLTGTITSCTNSTYGNFYLNDGTGEVLIYGLVGPNGETKYWATSGAKVGDDITVKTIRTEYNNAPQGKNATFVEVKTPGTLAFWSFEASAASFLAAGGEKTIKLDIYNATSEVVATSDNAQFSATYANGILTIYALENTELKAVEGNITVTCGSLSQIITVSQAAATSSEDDEQTEVTAELKFIGDNRTSWDTTKQTWEVEGVKLVNEKGSSTSNVADYVNPARFYKSSKITVTADGNISTIVFDCNSASYATALKDSIKTGTVSVSSDKVTVTLDGSSNEYVIASLTGGQVRMDSMTVTYVK